MTNKKAIDEHLNDAINSVSKMFNKKDKYERQNANREILQILDDYATLQRDVRFGQMLTNLGLSGDRFNEESTVTLDNVTKTWEALKKQF